MVTFDVAIAIAAVLSASQLIGLAGACEAGKTLDCNGWTLTFDIVIESLGGLNALRKCQTSMIGDCSCHGVWQAHNVAFDYDPGHDLDHPPAICGAKILSQDPSRPDIGCTCNT